MALSVTLIEYFAGAEEHDAMNTFNESYDNEAVTKAFEKFKEYLMQAGPEESFVLSLLFFGIY